MEETTLLIMSLVGAMIGLSCLYLLLHYLPVPVVDTLEGKEGELVRVEGIVEQVERRKGVTTVYLAQETLLPVVFFDTVEVKEGMHVLVEGKAQKYKGKREVLGNTITIR